jgi:hypothetical protein
MSLDDPQKTIIHHQGTFYLWGRTTYGQKAMSPVATTTLDSAVVLNAALGLCFDGKHGRHDSVHTDLDHNVISDTRTAHESDYDAVSDVSSYTPALRLCTCPLGGSNDGESDIIFSPCSTAPSTPDMQDVEFLGKDLTSSAEPPSCVANLVASFEALLRRIASFSDIAHVERALLIRLRSPAVTLADMEGLLHDARLVMLSDMERVRRGHRYVPGALDFDNTNIGCNCESHVCARFEYRGLSCTRRHQ